MHRPAQGLFFKKRFLLTYLRAPAKRPASKVEHRAQVAELVDAQVSGTCDRKVVKVRVLSWAPNFGVTARHARTR